jgi:hypothetical protein
MLIKGDATGVYLQNEKFRHTDKVAFSYQGRRYGDRTHSEAVPLPYLILEDQVSISRAQKYLLLQNTE